MSVNTRWRYSVLVAVFALGFVFICSSAQARNGSGLHPLRVTAISPASGPTGTIVTISGSGFGATQGTSKVGFDGVLARPTSWSATEIIVPVPAGASTGPIKICVAGNCVIAGDFTVTPTIISLDPPEGPVGTEVTIIGTGFGVSVGTSVVTFNGLLAVPTAWSGTDVVVTVPTGATTGPVVVTVGGFPSNGVVFTVTTN